MKKVLFILSSLFGFSLVATAQTRTDLINGVNTTVTDYYKGDTTQRVWKKGGVFNINAAQTSLNNWAAGGDNFAMSLNAIVNGHANYKKGKNSWDNNLDLNFGYINTSSYSTRKNADRIDLTSRYGHSIGSNLDLSLLFNLRTQFAKGYNYDSVPKYKISNFFAPAYITLAPGITYKPAKDLSLFISPATARWSVVTDKNLQARGLYGVDTGKAVKMQFGAYFSAAYTHNITPILSYTGRLDLFSNYLEKPQNVYMFMTNLFALKVSKVLSATWNFNLIYDDNARVFGPTGAGARLQTQSIVGVGLLYKFEK